MSAKQLRSERLALGVAGVAAAFSAVSQTAVPRASLVGQISRPNPFADANYWFPDDLRTIDHWIEFQALETKGKAVDALSKFNLNPGTQVPSGVIRLPMPSNVSTDFNPNYSTPDLGAGAGSVLKPFDQQLYNNEQGGNLLKGMGLSGILGGGITEGAVNLAATGATGYGLDAAAKAGGDVFGALSKIAGGVAVNPHKIVLFTGVDFRDHRFSWRLSPRNRDESNRIRDIIKMFTYFAHPEFVGGGLFFKYPEFFNIRFKHEEYLFKLQPSVCTDIQVNYHGQGFPAYIRDADGGGAPAPVEVELSLTFKETEVVTKNFLNEDIRNGAGTEPWREKPVPQQIVDKINQDLAVKPIDSAGPIQLHNGVPIYGP